MQLEIKLQKTYQGGPRYAVKEHLHPILKI